MEKLLKFLKRLEESRITYRLDRSPSGDAVRVHTWAADELWQVDFRGDGEIEVEVFRSSTADPLRGDEALEGVFNRMEKAWTEAARDLGIEFRSPFILRTEAAQEIRCAGLLPNFGGPMGTMIVSRQDPDEALEVADSLGYYAPGLNPRHYERYDRDRFIEVLSDWGWYGPEDARPDWLGRRTDSAGENG